MTDCTILVLVMPRFTASREGALGNMCIMSCLLEDARGCKTCTKPYGMNTDFDVMSAG